MHKRIVPVVFIIVIAILAFIFFNTRLHKKETAEYSQTSLPVSLTDGESEVISEDYNSLFSQESLVSLIPLNGDETLLGVITQDFDDDDYEDQINIIKNVSGPYISILIGLYNPAMGQYERSGIISTEITQIRTFQYTSLDLTGEHKNAFVYQGFKDDGNSVLKAFFIERKDGTMKLNCIADFEGDDSVFIQKIERVDAYERTLANGSPYPIWVYTSDTEGSSGQDQLQIMYNWNSSTKRYEEIRRTKESSVKLSAKELSKLNNGSEETYAAFLEGMWLVSDSKSAEKNNLFFNFKDREIIFLNADTAEVYIWESTHIRRNGVNISATNQDIANLKRHIDITVRALDQINVRLQDDLNMRISESTTWDGLYRKMTNNTYAGDSSKLTQDEVLSGYITDLESAARWSVSDGSKITFTNGNYVNEGVDGDLDTGIYTIMILSGKTFLQFRSDDVNSSVTGAYLLSYTEGENAQRNIILQHYILTPDSSVPSESRPLILTRVTE